jgi:hypothetical protein
MAGSLPVLVAPHTLGLDEADARFAVQGGGNRSPFQAMQELLNASEPLQWGIVSNGKQLRLLRDAASLTRPSWKSIWPTCSAASAMPNRQCLARLLHASRASAPAEALRRASGNNGAAKARGRHPRARWPAQWRRAGPADLGEGFLQHPANHALRAALNDGTLSKDDSFSNCCA